MRRDDGLLYEMTLEPETPWEPGEPTYVKDPFGDPVRPVGRVGAGEHHVAPMAFHFYNEFITGLWNLGLSEDDRVLRASETIHKIQQLMRDEQAHGGISMRRNGHEMVVYLDTVASMYGPTFAATLAMRGVDITVGDYGLRLRAPDVVVTGLAGRDGLASGDVFETGLEAIDLRPIVDVIPVKGHFLLLVDQPECRKAEDMIDLAVDHFPDR